MRLCQHIQCYIIMHLCYVICSLDFSEDEDFKYLQFDDNLVTISDTGKELGEFIISVKPAVHKVHMHILYM